MRPKRLLLVLACFGAGGCLLYDGPINRRPENVVITSLDVLTKGKMATFEASANDPDGDVLSWVWAYAPGVCPAEVTAENMPAPSAMTGNWFQITPPDFSAFCIWAQATDSHGAAARVPAAKTMVPSNQAPQAVMTRQQPGGNANGPFPLFSDFRVSAAASSDPEGEPLTREWSWTSLPNDRSRPNLHSCAPSDPVDMAACFHADEPGTYRLALTVSDGEKQTKTEASFLVAEDAPACLHSLADNVSVIPLDHTQAIAFAVTVTDDGDPYPPSQPSYATTGFPLFAWSLRRNGGAWQDIATYNFPTLTLAAEQAALGDVIDVRIEIADRAHPLPRTLSSCQDQSICAVTPSCAQRLTWKVMYQ